MSEDDYYHGVDVGIDLYMTRAFDAERWSRLWKQAAKKYRYFADLLVRDLERNYQRYYYQKFMKAEALAASRKELLKEIIKMLGYCPFCWANFKQSHATDCKLVKELGDD